MESNSTSDDDDIIEETVMIKSKLGPCEVCNTNTAKYTCPKCEVKTCCLNCNKIHKLELECDGQRSRTKFIPLKNFTNLDLSSDYRLLEEASRVVEVSKKGRTFKKLFLPKHLFRLQKQALTRKVTLKFLPDTFVRRRNNSTRYMFKENLIEWDIDWIFVNADNLKLIDKRVSETKRISTILDKYFKQQQDEEIIQEKLQYYQAVDLSGVRLFLKAEQKSGEKFYELDPILTLRECLRNKLIIEYPSIHVVLKEHGNCYDIIDSDDESEMTTETCLKHGNEVVNKIVRNAEKNDGLEKPLKNLLFVDENSDEEMSEDE